MTATPWRAEAILSAARVDVSTQTLPSIAYSIVGIRVISNRPKRERERELRAVSDNGCRN
jgi:uncharacterized DUF497 family protein